MRVPTPGQKAILLKLVDGPQHASKLALDGKSAVSLYECLREGWCEEAQRVSDRPMKLVRLTEHGAAFVVRR